MALVKYKYVKYDTGGGYIREGLEPHQDGEWLKAADVEAWLEWLLGFRHSDQIRVEVKQKLDALRGGT